MRVWVISFLSSPLKPSVMVPSLVTANARVTEPCHPGECPDQRCATALPLRKAQRPREEVGGSLNAADYHGVESEVNHPGQLLLAGVPGNPQVDPQRYRIAGPADCYVCLVEQLRAGAQLDPCGHHVSPSVVSPDVEEQVVLAAIVPGPVPGREVGGLPPPWRIRRHEVLLVRRHLPHDPDGHLLRHQDPQRHPLRGG
jgi:hypothetical protein